MARRMLCRACGHPLVAVRDLGPPVNLGRYLIHHRARWRNYLHTPVPPKDWADYL
jgi:hypothetical protein